MSPQKNSLARRGFFIKTFLLISFLMGASLVQCAFASDQGALTLTIWPQKQIYREGESINLDCTVKNASQVSILVNKRFRFPGPEIYLRLSNEKGEQAQWLPAEPPPPLVNKDFFLLAPSKFLAVTLHDIQLYLHSKLTPGAYTVQAIYRNSFGRELGINPWIGEIYSNTETFRVVAEAQ